MRPGPWIGPELSPGPLLALLDAPGGEGSVPAWTTLDPAQRRRQTLDALKALLLRESQEQPLLLVFEDLHWVDNETQALLDSLVESLPAARLLLLVNYRPEYVHDWTADPAYTELRIDPLPPASAEALLGPLLGDDPSVQPLRSLLIERTGGNPFFLEESVRALVEAGTLVGERGAYWLAGPVAEVRVPATVQAILAARIDRLAPWEKRLLQSAAVIGKDVPLGLLQAVADLPEEQLRHGLGRLQTSELLYERSLFPDLELTFKHALTHEVTYGSLLHDRRRALHARIVEAIEATAGDRLAGQVDRLAYHAVRGEAWEAALVYLRQAYARVMSHSAQREAVGYVDQALAALGHMPDSLERRQQAIDLRFQLRHALWALGELGRIRQVLEEAEQLAQALGDTRRRGWVSLYLCTLLYGAAEHDRAVLAGEQTVALAAEVQDETLAILGQVNLAQAHVARTDYQRAVGLASIAVGRLSGALLRDRLGQGTVPSVLARVVLVRGLVELGRFDESIAAAEEAVQIAEEVGHPGSLALASKVAGLPHLRRGDMARAIPLIERGVRLCADLDLPTYVHWIAPALGLAYAQIGRADDGVALLTQAIEEGATSGLFSQHSLTVTYLGEVLLLAGRVEEARSRALEGLELARGRGERGYQARALRLLGDVSAHQSGTGGQAERWYRAALSIAEELGMRPLVAECEAGLGAALRAAGDEPGADTHLARAAALHRELGIRGRPDRISAGR